MYQRLDKEYRAISALPKIIRLGAQTSNVSFMYSLMTQWYLILEQLFRFANSLHFILMVALYISSLEVGHDSTILISDTASSQPLFPFVVN